jgi:hypothetical protein
MRFCAFCTFDIGDEINCRHCGCFVCGRTATLDGNQLLQCQLCQRCFVHEGCRMGATACPNCATTELADGDASRRTATAEGCVTPIPVIDDPFALLFESDPRQPAQLLHRRLFAVARELAPPAAAASPVSPDEPQSAAAGNQWLQQSRWCDEHAVKAVLERHGLAWRPRELGLKLVGWQPLALVDESSRAVVSELKDIFGTFKPRTRKPNRSMADAARTVTVSRQDAEGNVVKVEVPLYKQPAQKAGKKKPVAARAVATVTSPVPPTTATAEPAALASDTAHVPPEQLGFAARRAARIAANQARLAAL